MVENELEFLFAGFAVFWAGLFVYLVILQARLRDLQREIDELEERLGEAQREPATTSTTASPPSAPGEGEPSESTAPDAAPASEAGTGS